MNLLSKSTNLDLYQYAEDNGIIVEHFPLKKNKSLSVHIKDRDFIALDNGIFEGSTEERTHLAHELGHCMTGAFYDVESPLITRRKYEYKAEKWAVLHFVPKIELLYLLKKNAPKWEICEHFGISEQLLNSAYKIYFGVIL